MTLDRGVRGGVRRDEVCQSLLGTLPQHARLPIPGLLMAVLSVGQLPQLSAGFGIGDDLKRSLERLPGLISQGPGLARQDFLHHLEDGLVTLQGLLLSRVVQGQATLGCFTRAGTLHPRAAPGIGLSTCADTRQPRARAPTYSTRRQPSGGEDGRGFRR